MRQLPESTARVCVHLQKLAYQGSQVECNILPFSFARDTSVVSAILVTSMKQRHRTSNLLGDNSLELFV